MSETLYHTAPTPRAWLLAVAPVGVGAFLLWTGWTELPRYHVSDPLRIPLGFGPALLGLGLWLATGWAILRSVGWTIALGGRRVRCSRGADVRLEVGWESLAFQVQNRGPYRLLLLSDGRRFVRIVDLFVPDFVRLAHDLEKHQQQFRSATRLKLD